MRGTRADLHQNGHKRFRNVFLTSDFEHGADWDKTRKVSSPFLPQSAKISAQKRRMPFSDFYEAGIGVKSLAGKLFSMFLGINRQTGYKRVNGHRGHDNLSDWTQKKTMTAASWSWVQLSFPPPFCFKRLWSPTISQAFLFRCKSLNVRRLRGVSAVPCAEHR